MGYSTDIDAVVTNSSQIGTSLPPSPRTAMHQRLPRVVQPFLTWLTAQSLSGDEIRERSPLYFLSCGILQILIGVALGFLAWPESWLCLSASVLLVTAGLGIFQVVIFHHCSHGTVFKNRGLNYRVGRLISVILLFKHFDTYQHEHMLHHSHNKLLTEEDEFANFVFKTCQLKAGEPAGTLRRRVLINLVSPLFHAKFTARRIGAAWGSGRNWDTAAGIAFWLVTTSLAILTQHTSAFILAWVLPVTVLLQIATVGRILCEHSFPELDVIRVRGRDLSTHATGGVFPGVMPPSASATTLRGVAAWSYWWCSMLTVQLLVRLVILVGDAPCHDFHHRKPASRRWTSYIQARQHDREASSAVFKADYHETWGLFRAIDATLVSLSRLPPGTEI